MRTARCRASKSRWIPLLKTSQTIVSGRLESLNSSRVPTQTPLPSCQTTHVGSGGAVSLGPSASGAAWTATSVGATWGTGLTASAAALPAAFSATNFAASFVAGLTTSSAFLTAAFSGAPFVAGLAAFSLPRQQSSSAVPSLPA